MRFEQTNPGLSQFEEQQPVQAPQDPEEEQDLPLLEDLGISQFFGSVK